MPSSFKTPLRLEYVDGRDFVVLESFEFWSTVADDRTFTVPAGFVTDFASVPRFLWWLYSPHGQYGKAAVVHDYCYRSRCVSRAMADRVFLEGMQVLGVWWLRRRLMWLAVRCFGWLAYRKGSAQ